MAVIDLLRKLDVTQWKTFIGDTASIGALAATFLGWVPHFAALVTAIWAVLRVYEMWLNIKIKRLLLQEQQNLAKERAEHGDIRDSV